MQEKQHTTFVPQQEPPHHQKPPKTSQCYGRQSEKLRGKHGVSLQRSKGQSVTHFGDIQDVLWEEVLPFCLIRVRSQPHSQAPRRTDGGVTLNVGVVSHHLQTHKGQHSVCGKGVWQGAFTESQVNLSWKRLVHILSQAAACSMTALGLGD